MAHVAHINPRILSWARETAGLSLEEAAGKLALNPTEKVTAAEKLAQIEQGERPVSRGLLEKAAAVYRRPLVAFYLAEPPARAERGEDFRMVAGRPRREDAMLDALVRDVRMRQQLLRDVLIDDEDMRPLSFVGSSRMDEGAEKVAGKIRAVLGVAAAQQRNAKGAPALFDLLRRATEQAGIFVLLLGDLGSHHSDLSEDIFRGIALADDIAPLVVINDNDAKTARSFTLLHELAHIWIGASGVSGPLKGSSPHAVERFCNEVAGIFLLPPAALKVHTPAQVATFELAFSLTSDVAKDWNVSQGVVTYQLLLNGWITELIASRLFDAFAERWRVQKQREKDLRDPTESGPDYYRVRRSRLGDGLLKTVRRALQGDVLTHTKAARILGVAPTSVDKLLKEQSRAA